MKNEGKNEEKLKMKKSSQGQKSRREALAKAIVQKKSENTLVSLIPVTYIRPDSYLWDMYATSS